MVIEDDIPIKAVAEELSIHRNTLYRWLERHEKMLTD